MTYAGGFFSITYMQDMTTAICNEATTPAVTATASDTVGNKQGNTAYVPERTLIDSRDNNTYIVRKLADGNCWMINNLILSGEKMLLPSDSDLNGISNFNLPAHTSTLYPSTSPRMYNTGRSDWGYYYNAYAISAGTYGSTTVGSDVLSSICPKNWRLPSGNFTISTNKSIGRLLNLYSKKSKLLQFPVAIPLGGHIASSNSITEAGTDAWAWLSTKMTDSSLDSLIIKDDYGYDSSPWDIHADNAAIGLPARCVSR